MERKGSVELANSGNVSRRQTAPHFARKPLSGSVAGESAPCTIVDPVTCLRAVGVHGPGCKRNGKSRRTRCSINSHSILITAIARPTRSRRNASIAVFFSVRTAPRGTRKRSNGTCSPPSSRPQQTCQNGSFQYTLQFGRASRNLFTPVAVTDVNSTSKVRRLGSLSSCHRAPSSAFVLARFSSSSLVHLARLATPSLVTSCAPVTHSLLKLCKWLIDSRPRSSTSVPLNISSSKAGRSLGKRT